MKMKKLFTMIAGVLLIIGLFSVNGQDVYLCTGQNRKVKSGTETYEMSDSDYKKMCFYFDKMNSPYQEQKSYAEDQGEMIQKTSGKMV